MYPAWINEILICPETKEKLKLADNQYQRSDGIVYPIKEGILSAVYPKTLGGDDAKYNKIYNLYAPLYDLNERVMGKLLVGVDMVKY
jgi:hypothetical protein